MLRRKRKWDKSLFVLGLIIAVVLASAVLLLLEYRTDPLSEALKKDAPLSFLFAISGDQDYRFFEVLQYHPRTNRGAVLFLPGNVGLIIESLKKVDRMDVLYRYGSIGALKAKVEQITGLSIPFYFELREQDVVSVVDLLGGLELFIPNPVEAAVGERKKVHMILQDKCIQCGLCFQACRFDAIEVLTGPEAAAVSAAAVSTAAAVATPQAEGGAA